MTDARALVERFKALAEFKAAAGSITHSIGGHSYTGAQLMELCTLAAAGLAAQAAVERVPSRDEPIPAFPGLKGRRYLVQDSDGNWYYLNHASTWQTCPPPHRDDVARARAEERERCAKLADEKSDERRDYGAFKVGNPELQQREFASAVDLRTLATAIRALGPTSDAIASARAAGIEECARKLEERANDIARLAVDAVSHEAAGRLEMKAQIIRDEAADLRALVKKEG